MIQFLLLPAIALLGIVLLAIEANIKMSKDFFAFTPAFFAAVFATYQKQYRELPINEKKNIGIRLFIALVMTIGNYILMSMVIQEKLNVAYFIDTVYMLVWYPIPIYSSSLFLVVTSIIVLVIWRRN